MVIKSENEYWDILIKNDYPEKPINVNFEDYFLLGFAEIENCDESSYSSAVNIYDKIFELTIFINQGYCLDIVPYKRWLLVNRKFIEFDIESKVKPIISKLIEVETDCYFSTKFIEGSFIIKSEKEYQEFFSPETTKANCLKVDFEKYYLIAEYSNSSGCASPSITKISFWENNNFVIETIISQNGLCEMLNHTYSTHLIEKKLIKNLEDVKFHKTLKYNMEY